MILIYETMMSLLSFIESMTTPVIQQNLLCQLDSLKKGEQGEIVAINEDKALLIKRRLNELGFIPGEKVRVYALAFPSKDPMAIQIGHTIFALRRKEAATITVKVLS